MLVVVVRVSYAPHDVVFDVFCGVVFLFEIVVLLLCLMVLWCWCCLLLLCELFLMNV